MKRSAASNDDARSLPLPLNIALFAGGITASIVMQLTGVETLPAIRLIQAWRRAGFVAECGPGGDPPRVSAAAREAAIATSTPRQRRRAYEAIARGLDDPDAAETDTLEIARYYRQSGHYRLAIARYLSVVERRIDRADRESASVVLAEIAESVPTRAPELLAVLDLQAQCAIAARDIPLAMSVLDRLRRLAGVCGDRFTTVRALLYCADCSLLDNAPGAAIDFASRAIELCGVVRESSLESATATLTIAQALCEQGRTAQAEARLHAAQTFGAGRDSAFAGRFRYVTGKLRSALGDPLAAAGEFRAAATAASDALDFAGTLQAARALAGAQLQSADLYSAASTLRGALKVARAQRLPVFVDELSLDLVNALLEAGRYGEARRIISTDLSSTISAVNAPLRLRVALFFDDWDSIERWSSPDHLEDAFASRSPQRIADTVPAFAALERRRFDLDAAEALYRRALEILFETGCVAPVEFWCDAAEFCAPSELSSVRLALNRARVEAPPLAALIVELGTIALDVRANTDTSDIVRRTEAVAAAFLTAGFKTWARRANAVTAKADLDARTGDVIALIAQGCSNGAIAIQLDLSKRSVEKTVSALLKLRGLRSRRRLTGLDRRLELLHSDEHNP